MKFLYSILIFTIKLAFIILILGNRYFEEIKFKRFINDNIHYLSAISMHQPKYELDFNKSKYLIVLSQDSKILSSSNDSNLAMIDIYKDIPAEIDYNYKGEDIKLKIHLRKHFSIWTDSHTKQLNEIPFDSENYIINSIIKSISYYNANNESQNFQMSEIINSDNLRTIRYSYEFIDIYESPEGDIHRNPSTVEGCIYFNNEDIIVLSVHHYNKTKSYTLPYVERYLSSLEWY